MRINILIKRVACYLLVLAAMVIFLFDHAQAHENWHLAKNKNNIKVYTRSIGDDNLKEYKAVTVLSCSMDLAEYIFDDVPKYPDWQANIGFAKVLNIENEINQYNYFIADVPWPLTDRDLVVYSTKTKPDNDTIRYEFVCDSLYMNPEEKYVRMQDCSGVWEIIQLQKNEVRVSHQFYGNPEGSVPEWFVNMFIVDGPYKTFMKLKRMINELLESHK
jgi:hypothetical protein